MKLYTEEEVRDAIEMAREGIRSKDSIIDTLNFMKPPIELPSDEGIKKIMELDDMEFDEFDPYHVSHLDGAKWMRDKIQGGNK
jgi:hypothetical protein